MCLCFVVTATAFAGEDDRGRDRDRYDDYCVSSTIPEPSTYGAVIAMLSIGSIVWFKRNRKS